MESARPWKWYAVDRRGEVYKIGEACKANPLAFHTGLPINWLSGEPDERCLIALGKSSILRNSLGPKYLNTAWTRLDCSKCLPRFPSNSSTFPLDPSMEARCPPAEEPQTAIWSGLVPSFWEFARNQRIASLQSWIWSGHFACPLKRQTILASMNFPVDPSAGRRS